MHHGKFASCGLILIDLHPFPRLFFSCHPSLLARNKHRQLWGFHLSVLPLVLPTQLFNLPSNECCTGSLSSNPKQLKSLVGTTFHLPDDTANLPLEWLLCFLFSLCSSSAHFSFSSSYSETISSCTAYPANVPVLPTASFFSLSALSQQAQPLDINIPDRTYPNKPLLRQLNQNFAL